MIASVIIAVKKDPRLPRAVASLFDQTLPRNDYEVIVVENGSDCHRHELPANVVYRHFARANMAAARNEGLRLAKGKHVLFTDADCVAAADWIEHIVDRLEADDGVAGIGGRIERYQPRTLVQRYGSNLVDGQSRLNYLPILDLPYVVGANSGFRSSLLREIGGFDDTFLSGNDVDLCYRLGCLGHRLGIEPRAVVYHENRETIAAHFRRFYRYSVYQVLLFRKYRDRAPRRWVLNTYPYRLLRRGLARSGSSVRQLLGGNGEMFWTDALAAVEALGVLAGDLSGAIKFRQPYI